MLPSAPLCNRNNTKNASIYLRIFDSMLLMLPHVILCYDVVT
jgi:hypothetical protein